MKKLLFVVLVLLVFATLALAEEPIYDRFVYLPVVQNPAVPTPTPTPTPRPTLVPPTPTSRPTATPPPLPICDCSDDLYNCGDFATRAQAQACYDYCVSQGYGDVHRLDGDNDGVVCEWLNKEKLNEALSTGSSVNNVCHSPRVCRSIGCVGAFDSRRL